MRTAWWKQYDWLLMGSVLVLVGLGLIMLLSVTIGTDQPYARNQAIFAAAGVVLFLVISRIDYRLMIQFSPLIYGACLLLLVLVAGFAQITRGAASWLDLGFFSLQPSEFMKLALILLMAYVWAKVADKFWSGHRLLAVYILALTPPLALILLQPDLGTALVMVAAWLGCVWLSPISKRLLLGLGVSALSLLVIGWLFLAPYQQQRIATFINPAADPLGHGYNVL